MGSPKFEPRLGEKLVLRPQKIKFAKNEKTKKKKKKRKEKNRYGPKKQVYQISAKIFSDTDTHFQILEKLNSSNST